MSEFIICDRCNGSGIVSVPRIIWNYCFKCRGTGRLTWLENIFGKNYPLTFEDENLKRENQNRFIDDRASYVRSNKKIL
jgi:DnaJ-class molecular chaperone